MTDRISENHSAMGPRWWVFFFGVVLLIGLAHGYVFPHENHAQELPPIMALAEPGLFHDDIAVQSFLRPGPRFYYQQMMLGLTSGAGMSMAAAYALVFAAALVAFLGALTVTARWMARNAGGSTTPTTFQTMVLAAALASYGLVSYTSWGSAIFLNYPVPAAFAMGPAAIGFYLALRRRWILAYGAFGVAAVFQFLVGFHAGLVVLPLLLRDYLRRDRDDIHGPAAAALAAAILLWGIGLALIYVPMMRAAPPAPAGFDFLMVFGEYRVPHHWLPSTGSALQWLNDAVLAAFALVRGYALARRGATPALRRIGWLAVSGTLAVIAGVVVNVVFVEVFPITLIGKLQFQRIIPFGHLLVVLLIGQLALSLLRARAHAALALLVVAPVTAFWPVVVASIAAMQGIGRERDRRWLVALAIPAGVVAVALALRLPFSPGLLLVLENVPAVAALATTILLAAALSRPAPPWLAIVLGGLAMAAVGWTVFATELPARLAGPDLGPRIEAKLHRMAAYDQSASLPGWTIGAALQKTPPETVVLAPPLWLPLLSWLEVRGKRAVWVSYKNVPYDEASVSLWSARQEELLGVPLSPALDEAARVRLFSARPAADLVAIARRHGLHYIITREDWHGGKQAQAAVFGETLARETSNGATWDLWHLPPS